MVVLGRVQLARVDECAISFAAEAGKAHAPMVASIR
jgi:hypothetical protein